MGKRLVEKQGSNNFQESARKHKICVMAGTGYKVKRKGKKMSDKLG